MHTNARTGTSPESQEPIPPALARVHIPHDPSLAHRRERPKRLGQSLIIHLWGKITDKDVEMIVRVFLDPRGTPHGHPHPHSCRGDHHPRDSWSTGHPGETTGSGGILVCPVHPDLRVKDLAPVQRLEGLFGGSDVGVFDETVVETAVLEIAVWDDLGLRDRAGYGEYLREHWISKDG